MPYQLAYTSVSAVALDIDVLYEILEVSRRNNGTDGVSGILMYHGKRFFQVLEGERTKVKDCLNRVLLDSRHSEIEVKWEGDSTQRLFPDWAMGYAGPDEIGYYTCQIMTSLDQIAGEKDSSKLDNNTVLRLAYVAFLDFLGENRFNSAMAGSARASR